MLVAVVAAGLTVGYLFGMPGRNDDASAERPALPEANAPLVVYTEFASSADALWVADPDDPSDRTQLALVPHAANYGIVASLSPDAPRVAYTVLPTSAADPAPDVPAQLWVLDLASADASLVADGIDLLVAPVWSPSGDAVVVRRSTWSDDVGGHFELLRVALDGTSNTLVSSSDGLFPIDFTPDGGAVYYASIGAGGTDLLRASLAGAAAASETVAHLSDGFARDWELSPDGSALAYLVDGPAGIAFEAKILDLGSGAAGQAIAGEPLEAFSPAWTPDGTLTLGRTEGAAQVEGGAALSLPKPNGGFDAPLSWSPDGAHLALRAFEGASVSEPGASRVVIANGSTRHVLADTGDLTVLGWLKVSP
ncbi:MAG: hypothetical protein WEB04_01855 [Dehalococcoidia bacterium]